MKQILLIVFMTITTKSMAFEIKTSVIINATPQQVWTVFTDFKNIASWNTFIVEISGKVEEGNKIEVELGGMKFTPKVLIFSKENEFKWKGKLIVKGLFDGTHQFLLTDNGDGTTKFEQNENFKGVLIPFLKKKLNTEIRSNFEQMNLALKKTIEKSNSQ